MGGFIQNCKDSVEDVVFSHRALEEMHSTNLQVLNQRIDTFSKHFSAMFQDQMQVHNNSVKEFTATFQLQNHHIEQLHKIEEANPAETWVRFTELEEHCSAIELDLADASSRLISSIDRL